MLKKTIKYVDFDGKECEDIFYFNLTKPELLELEFSYKQGMESAMRKMLEEDDRGGLLAFFKKVVLLSYGVKSEDGKRFIKNAEATEAFSQTNAYSELYMELLNNSDSAAAFINGIVPADLAVALENQDIKDKVAEVFGASTPKTDRPVENVEGV